MTKNYFSHLHKICKSLQLSIFFLCFCATAFAQIPVINSFEPTFATTGDEVIIRGNRLNNATAVKFGNVAADSFQILVDTAFYIKAFVGAGASGSVSVTNANGTGSKTGFTFYSTAPVINEFTPTSAAKGGVVFINGNFLNTTTAVSFGGVAADSFHVLVDTAYYLEAFVGSGASGSIRVTNPSGTATKSGFTFIAGNLPVISSFSPASAAAGGEVDIRGSNLFNATAVSFGGIAARSFQLLQDSTVYIRAIVDTGSTGVLSVTTASGTATKPGFIFIAPTLPLISGFAPISGVAGTTVTIRGKNLNNVTAVSFGGTPASSFNILIDTAYYINATVGNSSSGNITVTKSNGTSVSAGVFTLITAGINDTISLCPNGSVTIVSNLTGNTYQWQISSDTGYTNLANFSFFSGVNSKTLQISNIPDSYSGSRFRCVVNSNTVSKITTLKFANIWTGNLNNNWEEIQNWGCATKLPDANTEVIITNGTVLLNNSTTVKSIRVSPGATLILSAGVDLIIKNQ